MTAGLPGTQRVGSTFHGRILAAILVTTIAVAPARAYEPVQLVLDTTPDYVPLTLDTTPVSAEFTFSGEAAESVPESADEYLPDAQAETPAGESEPAPGAEPVAVEPAPVPTIDQMIYKGVVGNILEVMPLDPEQRVQLQRGNAVINNAFTGRSLALLLGIASPPLMIVGLIWGIWSAVNIKAAQADVRTANVPPPEPEVQAEQPASESQPAEAASSDEQPAADRAHVAAQSGE